ncbi:stage II sporulation protein R [Alicyclobacillus curvatus]|nr:stage II sporulation protein R [Alicyclobacillus curvatus]
MGTVKRLAVFVVAVASVTAIVRGLMGMATSGVTTQGGNTTAVLGGQTAASAGASSPSGSSAANQSSQSQNVPGFTTDTYDVATPHDAPIPSQALRLRIIANSDSTTDQNVKRAVRDAVVVEVAKLVSGAKTEQEAQQRVTAAIPKLREIAVQVTRKNGYSYPVKAMVGKAPFPTKLYGNQVYPAGEYKALVITLGKGQGANWWCVLFPPLCFIDIASGDAIPNTAGFPDLPPLETISINGPTGQPEQVQVRLAVLDYGEEAWKAVKRWFK